MSFYIIVFLKQTINIIRIGTKGVYDSLTDPYRKSQWVFLKNKNNSTMCLNSIFKFHIDLNPIFCFYYSSVFSHSI